MPSDTVTLKVTKETRRLLRLLAAQLDTTMQEAVYTAIKEALERRPPARRNESTEEQ